MYEDYPLLIIDHLNKINLNDNQYDYLGYNFLYKAKKNQLNKKQHLIVMFHGAISEDRDNRIIYRGFNWDINGADLLCMSDQLIKYHSKLKTSWFQSSLKIPAVYHYRKIIHHIINYGKYNKVIFSGSSAGGYPSLYFAGYFHKMALITNAQIYLKESNLYAQLDQVMNKSDDEIKYYPRKIESYLKNYRPQKIIIYNNTADYTYPEHAEIFLKFLQEKKINHEINLFHQEKDAHNRRFPYNQKHQTILQKLIDKLK